MISRISHFILLTFLKISVGQSTLRKEEEHGTHLGKHFFLYYHLFAAKHAKTPAVL